MRKVYPVVLTPDPVGYIVHVPDLDIDTQGRDLAEAIDMAHDAIGLWGICEEDDGRTLPEPSSTKPKHEPGELISWLDVDFQKYRRAHDMSTMHINVTIPRYLKTLADEAGINFSRELQDRIKERLALA